ncbi:twin-arginine translocase subunit TatC [Halomicroarcula sp. F28]|uniref:Sec-independent protein translocase protein TatC n=2 Tax=Haloarcula salinisoli TaxID=2487746 RepID=A0A8J7YE86_9EURY|nr:twin-arginine translocase subunit TatC [Halomicroarcula salinisoli]MBX0304280.1 twin-arginine translocase subunit TatC [Halomicroarcula salinisoli]
MADGTDGDDREWEMPRRESDVYPNLEMPGSPTPAADAGSAPSTTESAPAPEPAGSGGEFDGAPDDEEMPLADHVEEMATRLFIVLAVMAGVAVLALPYSDELINFLWYSFLDGPAENCARIAVDAAQGGQAAGPSGADCPHVYSPLALLLARLKVASLVGLIVALPVFVYQTYLFMRPGLYPNERRYYLAAVPTSLVLAAVGVAFAYFLVLRAMFDYFITYSDRAADLAFGLSETFNLIILMLGFFAIVFQIPLFVMLAIMMGLVTRQWLVQRRLYFWGAFAAIAFVFSPDPTGMAPLMVAVTMIGLFEGTLLLLKWTGTSSPIPSSETLVNRRPYAYLLFALVGYVLSPLPVPTGYYGALPSALTGPLAAIGFAPSIVVGGGIIGLFELTAYLNKNYYGSAKLWRGLRRVRLPVWTVAIVVGYLSTPDPTLFRLVDQFGLPLSAAAGTAVALLLLFEGSLLVVRRGSSEGSEE